jgi:hypothetical protein
LPEKKEHARDGWLFAIDAGSHMFRATPDASAGCALKEALQCALKAIKTKALVSQQDMVGIVLYNTVLHYILGTWG